MYEVSKTEEEMKGYPNPIVAIEDIKLNIIDLISKDGKNPNHYITQTTNEGKSLKMTAIFSEERKKHFEDNPL